MAAQLILYSLLVIQGTLDISRAQEPESQFQNF